MAEDELAARRWFRDRLRAIGTAHPELKTPEHQDRLKQELANDCEEDKDDGVQTDR